MAHLLKLSNDVKVADITIPNYASFIMIYNSTTDCDSVSYIVEEDGYLVAKITLQSDSGHCLVRIYINNGFAIEQNAKENSNYVYYTSAPIPVRKGDTIRYTLKSGESKGAKLLYLLKPR